MGGFAYLMDKDGAFRNSFSDSWDRILSKHPIPFYYCIGKYNRFLQSAVILYVYLIYLVGLKILIVVFIQMDMVICKAKHEFNVSCPSLMEFVLFSAMEFQPSTCFDILCCF